MSEQSESATDRSVAPSRVVAALAHNPNVRKGEARDNAVTLYLTNSGIKHTVLQHLRSLGYEVVSINPRFGTVRCVSTHSSIVAPDHDSTAIEYHRNRLVTDGGQPEGDTYRPYGDSCTVHTCDQDATRYVTWNSTGLTAGFCDRHAESKLAGESTSEVSR